MPLTDDGAALDAALDRALAHRGAEPVAVAASGGSDSTALLHLAARWAQRSGGAVHAVTVDHGLRAASTTEAEWVAALAARLGVSHATLLWHWDGRGNLQQAARHARRALIGAWAGERGIARVLLGHTRDDQAETVLLRLARGSGVDGLSGMAPETRVAGVTWLRPLLHLRRSDLRAWLAARSEGWIDDPSNADDRFDRVKARQALAAGEAGLRIDRLARLADHMARAQASLAALARAEAARRTRSEGHELLVDRDLLLGIGGPEDTPGRVVAAALMWVGGSDRRPRWTSLLRLSRLMAENRSATLGGCRIRPEGAWVRVAPEDRHGPQPSRVGQFPTDGAFGGQGQARRCD